MLCHHDRQRFFSALSADSSIVRISVFSVIDDKSVGFCSPTEPPCVLEKPESVSMLPGSKVHFNVGVSGTPPLNFRWFRNQKELSVSSDIFIIRDHTSSLLRLLVVKPSDSGLYACHINNDVGSASCQASLFVKGPHCFLTSSLFSLG